MKIARGCLRLLLCATAITWAGFGAASQKSSFTLSQVLSAPFPSDLIAARTKNRFAWVFNREGKRNIWIAEPAATGTGFTARQVTKYSEDDGQDVGELVFTPDAESIVYTRGGDFEFSEKPYPNPSKIVEGVEQNVWVCSLKGEPRKIGEGHSPAVSPEGNRVAYRFKDQIWLAKLDGSEKPQQLIHARGENGTLRWSPDGNFLGFVSGRGDHAFIGIYSFPSKTINYPDASTDKDSEPVWSPDSQKVALVRTPSSKDDLLFKPRRTGMPWSIRVIDVGTGIGHEIWKASEGRGSVFREVTAQNQLLWARDNKIVFPWERDGWTHLYSVSAVGGTPLLLTPGSFEVEDVSLSPDLEFVVYSSNQDDIDRRHIWRVGTGGGSPSQMTKGTGIETQAVTSSDGKVVAVLRSDARLPMRPAWLSGADDIHDLAPLVLPSDFPAAQMVTPQAVIFPAADGMAIHGQLFLPAAAGGAKRYPAVVFFHGGSERQMLLGWHYMGITATHMP